jgi:hypothetical protein
MNINYAIKRIEKTANLKVIGIRRQINYEQFKNRSRKRSTNNIKLF